ncbi:MAG TPA: metallophosphoesterase family protein, partial [Actinomycetota bacterium]|nr:metallophosphoesterase family protein [Actinomycetota bacterium]
VLAEVAAARVDLVVCGGDVVLGPMPKESLQAVRSLGERVAFVRGNADREVADAAPREAGGDVWARRAHWCAERLEREEIAFLAGLPPTVTVTVEPLGDVVFCHGTPRSDEEIVTVVTPEARLCSLLADVRADVVVAGHTHTQLDRAAGAVRFVNAGSVGMPYEREPGAYWALLGPPVDLRRTPYDTEAAAERIGATGYPEADELARENVLSVPSPDEAAPFFERMADERAGAAESGQAANSEK